MKMLNLFISLTIALVTLACNDEPVKPDDNPDDKDTLDYYTNPVFQPSNADPTIIKADDGYYYVYSTEDDWGDKNHLVPVIRSKNLTDWFYVGDAFQTKPDWKLAGGIWAPDIIYYDNKYFLFYSYSTWGDADPGIGLAVNSSPIGYFTDKGKLFLSSEVGVMNSIDPFFIEDDDGKIYLFWGSFQGIYGIELDYQNESFVLKGEKFQIAGPSFEATYIVKRNGYYYFFGSNGSCCDGENSTYNVRVARSDSIKGTYYDKSGISILQSNPVPGTQVVKGNESGTGFAGPGHNAEIITDDEGNDWLLYHAVDRANPRLPNGVTRRPLMLDKLLWPDEWPLIEFYKPSTTKQLSPVFNE